MPWLRPTPRKLKRMVEKPWAANISNSVMVTGVLHGAAGFRMGVQDQGWAGFQAGGLRVAGLDPACGSGNDKFAHDALAVAVGTGAKGSDAPKGADKHYFGFGIQDFSCDPPQIGERNHLGPGVFPPCGPRLGAVMRVSSKGRYAVVALVDVAQNSSVRPASLADVAQRQKISLSYLERLLLIAPCRAGCRRREGRGVVIVFSVPRPRCSVADVFQAVEDVANTPSEGGARDWSEGPAAELWAALDGHIYRFLAKTSLAELISDKSVGAPAFRTVPEGRAALSDADKVA